MKNFFLLFLLFLFPACSNNSSQFRLPSSQPSATVPGSVPSPLAPVGVFQISSVQETDKKNLLGVLIDPNKSTAPISKMCNTQKDLTQDAYACTCVFKWNETNRHSGTAILIPREIKTPVVDVQPYAAFCSIPALYETEILNGTPITLTLAQNAPGSQSLYQVKELKYIKQTGVSLGAFQDIAGNVFDNILRYTCYDQFKRGLTIQNRKDTSKTNPHTGEAVTFRLASQFCVAKADGSGSNTEGCGDLPPPQNSNEVYPYNLYIRAEKVGQINYQNADLICPLVDKNFRSPGIKNFYPLDQSFALSIKRTQDFDVGVTAQSTLAIGGDSTSEPTSCDDTTPKKDSSANNGNNNGDAPAKTGITLKCLGFAKRTNPDGSCPIIKSADNQNIQLFRLRRHVNLYPPHFDTDGKMLSVPPPTDTVYVIDRPVLNPNPSQGPQYYSMLGPKPCPFSFFDQHGVTRPQGEQDGLYRGKRPGWVATGNPDWLGKNVDGIELPNQDTAHSCAATLPLYNPITNVWSLGTVHPTNQNPKMKRVFIRPIEPFVPHYEEDTDFRACAPLAAPLRDPPLHFAKNKSAPWNVGYCAETNPTQYPDINKIEPQPTVGLVVPHTSHVPKNADSPPCNATKIALSPNYPQNGVARHPASLIVDEGAPLVGSDRTCDRTIDSPGPSSPLTPLLARPRFVESAITSDPSYSCTITQDFEGGKAGKRSPKTGCCAGGVVYVWSGNPSTNTYKNNFAAHWEPSSTKTTCGTPEY